MREAAQLLGISAASAYRAAHSGDLPVIRIRGRILVLREPFERLLRGDLLEQAVPEVEAHDAA